LQRTRVHPTGPSVTVAKRYPVLDFTEFGWDAVTGAEVVVVLTEWKDDVELDPAEIKTLVAEARVVDGRNCLDPVKWREDGWVYRALGRSPQRD
jgi:UDPglucose 6-dehydrogenase